MENPPNMFIFSVGAKTKQKEKSINKSTMERMENPNEEPSQQVYLFTWSEKTKNIINKSPKKPMEDPMEKPPNKFTTSIGGEQVKKKRERKT